MFYVENFKVTIILFYFSLVPGVTDFISMNNTPPIQVTPPAWSAGLTYEDINAMHRKYYKSKNLIYLNLKKICLQNLEPFQRSGLSMKLKNYMIRHTNWEFKRQKK